MLEAIGQSGRAGTVIYCNESIALHAARHIVTLRLKNREPSEPPTREAKPASEDTSEGHDARG